MEFFKNGCSEKTIYCYGETYFKEVADCGFVA